MSCRFTFTFLIAAIATSLILSAVPQTAQAATLIGDPYISSYQNWVDPIPARNGDWRLNLVANTVIETSDLVPTGNNPAGATNNGSYVPTLLIQNNYVTPSTYDLNARMYSSDDDGWGLIFGYQDSDNYYRVLFRAQANGNLGGTVGTSVQKVVAGAVTQISPVGTGPGNVLFPTLAMISTPTTFDVRVAVDGVNYAVYAAGVNEGNPLQSGSDAGLLAGKIGVQSWAQQIGANTDNRYFGTQLETISVSDNTGTLYSGTFVNPSIKWRSLAMANSAGLRTSDVANAGITGDDSGNFGLGLKGPWIHQRSNGFNNATELTPNVDFIGPAVVVDEVGATSFSDYEMKVRMGATDNDGYGLLVRVLDDDNYYRINFHADPGAIGSTRPPRGMSVQKVLGGVWTELYRDNQEAIPFVPPVGTAGQTPTTGLPMFDVRVDAIRNTLAIQVIDHLGNIVDYPLITDATNPLLSGTAGLHTWGTENTYFTGYGGQSGPLLVEVPEPATACLLMLAALGLAGIRRRHVCN